MTGRTNQEKRLMELEEELANAERVLDFVATWAWRHTTISDSERLSAVKWHPAIRKRGMSPPTPGALE